MKREIDLFVLLGALSVPAFCTWLFVVAAVGWTLNCIKVVPL